MFNHRKCMRLIKPSEDQETRRLTMYQTNSSSIPRESEHVIAHFGREGDISFDPLMFPRRRHCGNFAKMRRVISHQSFADQLLRTIRCQDRSENSPFLPVIGLSTKYSCQMSELCAVVSRAVASRKSHSPHNDLVCFPSISPTS
jgi:hypothetical protein